MEEKHQDFMIPIYKIYNRTNKTFICWGKKYDQRVILLPTLGDVGQWNSLEY